MEQKLPELIMEDEVADLCGKPYERDLLQLGRYKRWGSNPGPIRIRGERVRFRVPRVRDVEAGQERPLESYRKLHRPTVEDQDRVTGSILLGLSQRDYHRVARTYADSFRLSTSSVSRTFQERSVKALEAFEQRNLASETYVALAANTCRSGKSCCVWASQQRATSESWALWRPPRRTPRPSQAYWRT